MPQSQESYSRFTFRYVYGSKCARVCVSLCAFTYVYTSIYVLLHVYVLCTYTYTNKCTCIFVLVWYFSTVSIVQVSFLQTDTHRHQWRRRNRQYDVSCPHPRLDLGGPWLHRRHRVCSGRATHIYGTNSLLKDKCPWLRRIGRLFYNTSTAFVAVAATIAAKKVRLLQLKRWSDSQADK